jgi:hypothetical protein
MLGDSGVGLVSQKVFHSTELVGLHMVETRTA